MEKTRGAHSFRPRVRQGSSSPAVDPSLTAAGSSATNIDAAGPSTAPGPSAAVVGVSPSAPAVHPTSAPAVAIPAGDAEGSSSMVPAHRRYHTLVGRTPPAPWQSQTSPKGPTGQEGLDIRPRGVIYIEIQGVALSTLSGCCRSPRPVSGVHHQATLLPLRPYSGEC